jgi:hypothetical protein
MDIRAGDWAIVFATVMGPILAVQIQKLLDRRSERNRRQVEVFRALMASRMAPNSDQHVNALNAVPLEFHGQTEIIDAWRDLLLHLNTFNPNQIEWNQRRVSMFVELLKKMAKPLHYDFRDAELHEQVYYPQWQVTLSNDQELVRKGLVELFAGNLPLNMNIKEFPGNVEMAKRHTELQTLLIEWLEGKRAPQVTVPGTSSSTPAN